MIEHYMLDTETLSTRSDAAVFEVAILKFSPGGNHVVPQDRHVWRIKVETGHICPRAVHWWSQQERKPNWTHGKPEADAAKEIHEFFQTISGALSVSKNVRVWAKPTAFDAPILMNFLRRYGFELPVHMGYWRDLRSVLELAGFPGVDLDEHDAEADCLSQIKRLNAAWKILTPTTGAF